MIEVRKIETPQEQAIAHKIREEVFVKEQNVPFAEEYDEYEQTSVHFLAFYEGKPCGTARWRFTENGIKLERFAVLKEFRNKKVGKAILEAVLENIKNTTETAKKNFIFTFAGASSRLLRKIRLPKNWRNVSRV
jgi:predicted GNAT family N-acyltransferase